MEKESIWKSSIVSDSKNNGKMVDYFLDVEACQAMPFEYVSREFIATSKNPYASLRFFLRMENNFGVGSRIGSGIEIASEYGKFFCGGNEISTEQACELVKILVYGNGSTLYHNVPYTTKTPEIT